MLKKFFVINQIADILQYSEKSSIAAIRKTPTTLLQE